MFLIVRFEYETDHRSSLYARYMISVKLIKVSNFIFFEYGNILVTVFKKAFEVSDIFVVDK